MSIAAGILRGLLKQGLSDINQTNEFYNDIVQTAGLNLTNATNTVNTEFPKDIKLGEEKYNRYLSTIDMIGKDKADFIFENTKYLDADNWMDLVKQSDKFFGTDFKWTARTEPIETMNKNINMNRTNLMNRINNTSSMKGMKQTTSFLTGQVPDEFTLEPSALLGTGEDTVPMTTEERQAAVSQVILPTELVSEATTNAGYMAMIHKTGGDIEAASKIYGIPIKALANAKHEYTNIDPFQLKAFSMVDMKTPFDTLKMQGYTPDSDVWKQTVTDLSNQLEIQADILRSVSSDKIIDWSAITDNTVINLKGENMKFSDFSKEMKELRGKNATRDNRIETLKKENATIISL